MAFGWRKGECGGKKASLPTAYAALVHSSALMDLLPASLFGYSTGVFLVTTANAILPVDRDHSVNTDS